MSKEIKEGSKQKECCAGRRAYVEEWVQRREHRWCVWKTPESPLERREELTWRTERCEFREVGQELRGEGGGGVSTVSWLKDFLFHPETRSIWGVPGGEWHG